jgi:hypothetical protein
MTAKRVLTMICALAMLAFSGAASVMAQDATPVNGFGDLGLPELSITVSQAGYEGVPDQVEAGRYLVTVTPADDLEFGGGVGFIRPPEGMTADEFLAALAGPPDEGAVEGATGSPAAAMPEATPADQMAASPAAEEGTGGPPPFIFEATFAGGIFAGPGDSVQVVVDLGPGEWIAWPDDPAAGIPPVIFEVTGEMPADQPEPVASATITMAEYTIAVSEGTLSAGPQIVRVDNVGAQPHHIFWDLLPAGTTPEQVQAWLDAEMAAQMSGTPAAVGEFNPDDVTPVTGTATQSTGTSLWVYVDVPVGTNGLICFFPDLGDGIPHAFHGMFTVIEVTG